MLLRVIRIINNKGRPRGGVKPPYLGFGVLVDVLGAKRITGDLFEKVCRVERIADSASLASYTGTVPVTGTEVDYFTHSQLVERDVVVGTDTCKRVIESLIIKASKSSDETRFRLGQIAL